MDAPTTSWLCRDDADRRRVLEMERRVRPFRVGALVLFGLALTLAGPNLGFWTLIPLGVCAVGFAIADHGLAASRRPENRLALAWLLSEVSIAAGVALTGGPRSPAAAWLAAPVVTLGARFGQRGLSAGSACALLCMLGATVGVDPAYALHHPENVILPASLVVAVSILSTAQMRSELEYRGAAAVDALTGLLNRNALTVRVAELRQQAALRGQSVGLIIIDIDRFKEINDQHGHGVGDIVLRECALRLSASLQAFDPIYRLGGEEFLVLLPGLDLGQTRDVATDLCRTVGSAPIEGLEVTVSCGASASGDGGRFDYDRVLAAADDALYLAKRAGRNRVRAQAVKGSTSSELDEPRSESRIVPSAPAVDPSGREAGGPVPEPVLMPAPRA